MSGDDPASVLAEYAASLPPADSPTGATRSVARPGSERSGDGSSVLEDLSDATVVGLGEPTHGAREFVDLRGRLTRHLVAEGGFRAVGLEAGAGAALPVSEYVLWGEGDPETAVRSLNSWFWHTEGVLALVEWLRAFNEGRPLDERVRCYGVDVDDPTEPFGRVGEFLETAGPDYYESVREEVERLAGASAPVAGDVDLTTPDRAEALATGILARVEDHRATCARRTSEGRVGLVVHCCRAVRRTCEWLRAGGADPGFDPAALERRDVAMADAARWAASRHGGCVLWAHNAHVKRGSFDLRGDWDDAATMGESLARELGGAYRPVGGDFAGGRIRATRGGDAGKSDGESSESGGEDGASGSSGTGGPQLFAVAEYGPEWATAALDAVGGSSFVLDVAAASADTRLASWFDEPRPVRAIGSVFDPSADPVERSLDSPIDEAFDAVVFCESVRPSRPLGGDGPVESR